MSDHLVSGDVFGTLLELGASDKCVNSLKTSESTIDETIAAEVANLVLQVTKDGKNPIIDTLCDVIKSDDTDDVSKQ